MLALGCVGACATNPVTGQREFSLMSEAQEIAIGQQLDVEIQSEMGLYDDDLLQQYVENIGLRLAAESHRPNLPWHFTIVDVPAVNAFALPGGYIYITRGIMTYLGDEAALAGVLGHEIGHVTARHAAQAYTRATGAQFGLLLSGIFAPATRSFGGLAETGLGLLFLRYGRDAELQADRVGAEYAGASGWDPDGVADMLTTLSRLQAGSDRGIPNWLATHPAAADRVTRVQETIQQVRTTVDVRFTTGRDEYLRRIQGMVVGDNPEEGIIRGSAFLHPTLRFGLQFPDGWEIVNSSSQVVAQLPGDDVYLVLQLVEQPGGTLEDIATRTMRSAGYRQESGAAATINGLDAYVGTYSGRVGELGEVLVRAAHIVHRRDVFLLAGVAPRARFERVAPDFERSVGSFRQLSAEEADGIRPNRLDLYVVQQGDTWQSIAQRASGGNVAASTLAIMNGYPVNEQPLPNDRIKIVVEG